VRFVTDLGLTRGAGGSTFHTGSPQTVCGASSARGRREGILMRVPEGLAACAGSWSGRSTLQDPEANIAEESATTATMFNISPEGQEALAVDAAYGRA
jgi:hypothetical protein